MCPLILTASIALMQANVPEPRFSPADAIRLCSIDLASREPTTRASLRYLWLGNVPQGQREKLSSILSGHVNGLSRSAEIVKPASVASGLLMRLDLADYEIDARVWEQLIDPLFSVTVEVEVKEYWPGGVWSKDGKHYPAGNYPKKVKQRAAAPWLPAKETSELISLTQSQSPVVSGLWFLNQTAIQANRSPGYYDLLAIKNQKDFFALVGFDQKLAANRELREAVSDSGVTQQPRRIERQAVIGGGLWRTFDSARATDRKNPLRVLDDEFQFDASEEFGPLPNGLMAWGLFDAKGARQDSAPDSIARDHTSGNNDGRVHVGLSCIRCHGPSSGLNSIDGWARSLFGRADIGLQSPDYEKARVLRRQYLRKLEPFLEKDRVVYAEAILEATGLSPREWASEYGRFFALYEDARVDSAWVARDFGIGAIEFQDALKRYASTPGSVLDPSLAAFLRKGGKGLPIRQYEESIGVIWAAYTAGKR